MKCTYMHVHMNELFTVHYISGEQQQLMLDSYSLYRD